MKFLLALAFAASLGTSACSDAQAVVNTTTNSISYTGNGSISTYSIPFSFEHEGDLVVTVGGIIKTLGVDYTVAGVGSNYGGSITLTAGALGSGVSLNIVRVVGFTQPTSFRSQSFYSPGVHENAFDWLEYQIQEIASAQADGGTFGGVATSVAPGAVLTSEPITGDGSSGSVITFDYSHAGTFTSTQTFAVNSASPSVTATNTATNGPAVSGTSSTSTGGVFLGAPGINAQAQTGSNSYGGYFHGQGSGQGIYSQGGLTAAGVYAQGGSLNGPGIVALGGASGADGIDATGGNEAYGSVGGAGGTFIGTQNQPGVNGIGAPDGGPGGIFTGGLDGGAGIIANGGNNSAVIANAGTNSDAIQGYGGASAGTGGQFSPGSRSSPVDGDVRLYPLSGVPSAPTNGALWDEDLSSTAATTRLVAWMNGSAYVIGGNPSLQVSYTTTGPTIATATDTVLKFATTGKDTDSGWSASTGLYTVPANKGGDYAISAQFAWTTTPSSSGTTEIYVSIGGSTIPCGSVLSNSFMVGTSTIAVHCTAAVAAGSTIGIHALQGSGSSLVVSDTAGISYLTVHRLSD